MLMSFGTRMATLRAKKNGGKGKELVAKGKKRLITKTSETGSSGKAFFERMAAARAAKHGGDKMPCD